LDYLLIPNILVSLVIVDNINVSKKNVDNINKLIFFTLLII